MSMKLNTKLNTRSVVLQNYYEITLFHNIDHRSFDSFNSVKLGNLPYAYYFIF